MKKKILLTGIIVFLAFIVNAQLNVSSATGGVSAGTVVAPPSSCSFLSFSNALFTGYPTGTYSAAYIRAGGNSNSTATNPDYTWWYDDQTGMYHPYSMQMGFSIAGVPQLLMQYDWTYGPTYYFNGYSGFYFDWQSAAWGGDPIIYPAQAGWLQLGSYPNHYLGDAYINHVIVGIGVSSWSDSSIKTNINYSMDSTINKLKLLKPATYYFKPSFFDSIPQNVIQRENGYARQYGLIAQDLVRVYPELVYKDSASGLSAVNYTEIIPMLIKAFQIHDSTINKQQQEIIRDSVKENTIYDSLQSELKRDSLLISNQNNTIVTITNYLHSVQSCLDSLCGISSDRGQIHHSGNTNGADSSQTVTNNVLNVILTNSETPILYQNIPNPFSSGTKINYYVPESSTSASIIFYDTYGKELKIVTLIQMGNGTLNVAPENLASGIYSYSLIVNGKVIDTKRMILQ